MPDARLKRTRQAYADSFALIQSGICSQCGWFSGRDKHVCPDGSEPIDMTPRLTKEDMRDLFEDG